jgi:4-hydroxybenzoate polyprenyltransferase
MARTAVQSAVAFPRTLVVKTPIYLASIRVWESLYAAPFAYIGMLLAADGWPGWSTFIWLTVALAGVRTLGMSANRLVHAKEDAANPRTMNRHMPRGLLKTNEVWGMMLVSTGIFLYAASQLNGLALALAPVAAAYVVLYSYAKYHTWGCHFILGLALGIAPSAAWIGVTGRLDPEPVLLSFAVATWAGGFDVIYGCADLDFDKQYGVYSLPKRFGVATALWVTKFMHLFSALALLGVGLWLDLGFYYFIGWAIAVSLLAFENTLVRASNLSKLHSPFFKYNSLISMLLLIFTILAVAT